MIIYIWLVVSCYYLIICNFILPSRKERILSFASKHNCIATAHWIPSTYIKLYKFVVRNKEYCFIANVDKLSSAQRNAAIHKAGYTSDQHGELWSPAHRNGKGEFVQTAAHRFQFDYPETLTVYYRPHNPYKNVVIYKSLEKTKEALKKQKYRNNIILWVIVTIILFTYGYYFPDEVVRLHMSWVLQYLKHLWVVYSDKLRVSL